MSIIYPHRTKLQSLYRLRTLWTLLSKRPLNKSQAYALLGWSVNSDKMFCAACTYHQTHQEQYCGAKCIINWPGGACISADSNGSTNPFTNWPGGAHISNSNTSAYTKWSRNHATYYAKQMLQIINDTITEEENNNAINHSS